MLAETSELIYVVVAGDTLNDIAARFGTTVDQIVADNDIEDPDLIEVGQELMISTSLPVSVGTPNSVPPTPEQAEYNAAIASKNKKAVGSIGAYVFASIIVGAGIWYFFKRKSTSNSKTKKHRR